LILQSGSAKLQAMVDLTTIQWHNKKMQDEMQSLRVEHALFEELHNKMEIELLEKGEEIQKIIDGSYELFEERHDYQKLISGSSPPKVPFFDQFFQHFLSINKLLNSRSKYDRNMIKKKNQTCQWIKELANLC
jgi:hypothetical protein